MMIRAFVGAAMKNDNLPFIQQGKRWCVF